MGNYDKGNDQSLFAHPMTGQLLTIASGLVFLFLSMILGIVGPAAARGSGSPGATQVEWYGKNVAAFLFVLFVCLALAVLAIWSKLQRRKIDESPLPVVSFGIAAVCVFLFLSFVTGLLAV